METPPRLIPAGPLISRPQVLESHPEQSVPLSRCDNERRRAVGSHFAFALCLYDVAACHPSSSCRFWVFSDRNGLQLRVSVCNLVVIITAIPLLRLPYYSFLAVSEILNHPGTFAVPSVYNTVGLLILLKLYSAFTFLQQLVTKGLRVLKLQIHLFSEVFYRRRRVSPRRPCIH